MKDRVDTAIFSESFPVNPIPFAKGIADHVRENGTDSIQSDTAKRILWILMSQAYGQIATIDLCAEWDRLYEADNAGCDRCGIHDRMPGKKVCAICEKDPS